MEPEKNLKKFIDFNDNKVKTNRTKKFLELPMGDTLGIFLIDSTKPLVQNTIQPHFLGPEDRPIKNVVQPIQIVFRDGMNVPIEELKHFIEDWLHNLSGYKKNMCVKLYNKNENQDSYYERWDLRNCFPTAIHYIPNIESESDWETIEITLHYDYCSIY